MSITAGTRLGSYEVIAQIGAGGMGEVYKAHDAKLARDVAIKVLPEAFAHDSDRLARFQREAKMLASLNHPNIASIYSLEQSNGTNFLIMELVAGETLAERIKREGAVPVEEALKIAVQIAEALEAAHEKGIIHRDLKPANVKVTPEGKVKVLDFGLAKAFGGDDLGSDPSNSPTLSQAATMQGVILGTAAYMSPEQARGKAVDKRTDIWAFGCLLLEMLTGKQAFTGEGATDILAAVVRAEPDWNRLPPATPAQIRSLLRRCLQKDKVLRMQAAGDARIEIQEALTAPSSAEPVGAVPSRLDGWRLPMLAGLAALVVAAVAGFAVWNLKPTPIVPHPVSRLGYDLPQDHQFRALGYSVTALSPDGSRFVYNTNQGLYLRSMDQLEARLIAGTEQPLLAPFFSPDGQWVGYWQDGQLKKIGVSGGSPVSICKAAEVLFGATWEPDNTILFAGPEGIERVSANGGSPELIIKAQGGEQFDGPQLLPSGEWVLFAVRQGSGSWDQAVIVTQSLKSKQRRKVWQGGSAARYVPTGHIVYAVGDNLFAIPFNLASLSATGGPVPLLAGVLRATANAGANYGISENGSLVYLNGSGAIVSLVWVDRAGKEESIAAPPHNYGTPRLSPDGQHVAVAIVESGDIQIWLYDLRTNTLTRWTFEGNNNFYPAWTPDGQRIAFGSDRTAPQQQNPNIFWQRADSSGGVERLTTSQDFQVPSSWSPDGRVLAFVQDASTTGNDIWVLPMGDSSADSGQERKPRVFLQTRFSETTPRFSPDGHWIAYVSNESGRFEVYVQPYPGPGGKWQISTEGGTEPVWNPKGREIFYRSGNKMMAEDVGTAPTFSTGKPRLLFQAAYFARGVGPNYDVSPDGQRFLMLKPAAAQGQAAPAQIIVVQNWTEELKRRVPTGK